MTTRIFAFIAIIAFCSFALFAEGGVAFPIKQTPGNPGSFPRTPNATTPITAYYQSGVIYIQFSEDLGYLDVEVINSTTNQQWIDVACSDNSTEAIVISTTPGNYTITLTTEDGIEYSGQFTL